MARRWRLEGVLRGRGEVGQVEVGADAPLMKWCHEIPLRRKILLNICINTVRKWINRKK